MLSGSDSAEFQEASGTGSRAPSGDSAESRTGVHDSEASEAGLQDSAESQAANSGSLSCASAWAGAHSDSYSAESRADPGVGVPVRLHGPADPEERAELERWRRAVGPPVVFRPEAAGPGRGASQDPGVGLELGAGPDPAPGFPGMGGVGHPGGAPLVLVAWNTNVGRGDLSGLVADLRSGGLTGFPAHHFVLLLQEAFRHGPAVPDAVDEEARGADRIGSSQDRNGGGDIHEFARKHGLHLFYAPSMRNGLEASEDRGNAILSTLPLTDFQVVELPVQKQRRIAVAATVGGGPAPGLRVVSVHLDHMSSWRRLHRSLGADRALHAERLVDAFTDEERIVVGGDFNSWFGGNGEEAIRLMRSHFPGPVERPVQGTLETPLFPFNRLLDHLFFRLPEGWSGEYRVAPSRYGSDHRPLVGWVRGPEDARVRVPEDSRARMPGVSEDAARSGSATARGGGEAR